MPTIPVTRRFFVSMLSSSVWWATVAAALIGAILVSKIVEEKTRAEFDYRVASAASAIDSSLRSHRDVLRGVGALFHAGSDVSHAQFHAYVAHLELQRHFPAVMHLHHIRRLTSQERPAFLSRLRNDTSPLAEAYRGFSVKPAGERPEYLVLAYREPPGSTGFALGTDFTADAALLEMLLEARDSGELSLCHHLFAAADLTPGSTVVMHVPIYRAGMPLSTVDQRRAAYTGAVGVVLDVPRLLDNAIGSSILSEFGLKLHDGGKRSTPTQARGKLLHATRPSVGLSARDSLFVKEITIDIGSRLWRAEFSAQKSALASGLDMWLPTLTFIAGLIGAMLLYGAYYALTTARGRALELAEEMTRDLRASKTVLAEAQQMARLGSWLLHPDDDSMIWSEETFHLFGMQRYSITPTLDDFAKRVHEEDRERIIMGIRHALDCGNEFSTEHRIRQRGLGVRWVQLISRPTRDGNRTLLRGAMMDITERKQTMEALKRSQELLRDLTIHQERVREDERRRIAREIHDELGQTLLALRIDVSMLEARTGERHPRLNQRVREALQQIDATVKTIRTIINNLRPAVLDLGLAAAMEWQVKEFRRRSGLICELHLGPGVGVDGVDGGHGADGGDANQLPTEIALDDVRATTLFRILQESLTNVIRHARATKVVIELRRERQRLVMTIGDNGIGMRPEARRPGTSFGLLGVEERVHALQGEFRIDSAAGEGTRLTIFIPLETELPSQRLSFGACAA